VARESKRLREFKGPGTYTEALTTTKMAIFGELYREDKLNEDDQQYILDVLGGVLRWTPVEELPHLKSYRLEGDALIYICVDQQSSQWLFKAINNHRLKTGTMLKVTEARNLPKPVKVALRVRDNVAQTQDELLQWVKSLNPGLNTKHWKVLDKQSETKGQRLIMHIDRDSLVTIRSTGNKISTGLSQGTVKVLKDPEAPKTEAVLHLQSLPLRRRGMILPLPRMADQE
jgi:hypothetical protein